jgi:hypothetical protein
VALFRAHVDRLLMFSQCVRAYVTESKVFVSMVLILIFAEVLGLYGYVVLSSNSSLADVLQTDCSTHHELTGERSHLPIAHSADDLQYSIRYTKCIPIYNWAVCGI